MSPQRPDLVLSSNIPNIELYVLVGNGLDVESDGRNSSDALVELKLVKNGCRMLAACCEGCGSERFRSRER